MKLLITFAILIVCTIGLASALTVEEGHAKVKTAVKKCQENPDTAAPQEEIEAAKKGVVSEKVKKHLLCVSKTLQWQNEDGTVNSVVVKEKILAYLSPEKYEEIKNECTVDKETPEETASNLFRCYKKYFK